MVALDRHRVKLVVFDEQILILANFESASLLSSFDRFTRYVIDELLAQAIASASIDLAEGDAFAR